MAFWGGFQLAEEIPALGLVRPYDPSNIDCNAYTLTMGEEYYVTPDSGLSLRKSHKRFLKSRADLLDLEGLIKRKGESFVIPPGQFAFLLTEEIVRVPAHAMGFISLKSKTKFRGLINVSGFHVDPGFEGKLIYSVYNAGPSTLHISRGEPLFLMWFADVGGPIKSDDRLYYKNQHDIQIEIPSNLISDVAVEVQSLQGLAKKVEELQIKINTAYSLSIFFVALLTLAVGFIAIVPHATIKNIYHFIAG